MVDVNSFTCSLIAFPTPLPPKKILTNRCNYPLHQQSLWVFQVPTCNVFLPDIGDDWEALLSSPMQVFGAFGLQLAWQGEWSGWWFTGPTLPPCYSATPLQYVHCPNPLLWNTYPATSSAIYPTPFDPDRFNTLTLYVPMALQHCRLTTCEWIGSESYDETWVGLSTSGLK